MYLIIKDAIYNHGTWWIGEDLDTGFHMLELFIAGDSDDRHEWSLCRYVPQNPGPTTDPVHQALFKGRKGEEIKKAY